VFVLDGFDYGVICTELWLFDVAVVLDSILNHEVGLKLFFVNVIIEKIDDLFLWPN
jgi:hypothetical protein